MPFLNVNSEIGRLKTVVLHRPGIELENLTPKWLEELLFDDIPWLDLAVQEHDAFAKVLTDHGVELREHGANLGLLVHGLDEDGQVRREMEDARGVDARIPTEALDAAQDGGPGEATPAQQLHDGLIEGTAIVVVGLADVDAHQQRRTIDLHGRALPTASPATTAIMPTTTEPARLAKAKTRSPSSTRRQDSSMSVEKVV